MAIPVYLWLKDDGGADIKGSVDVQDREGSIEVVAQEHNLYIPTDNNTGKLTGISLSGATVYFKAAKSSSQSLNVPSSIKEGSTTDWININSDNDNKRCVSKITFSGNTVNSSDMATLKVFGDD